MPWLKSAEHNMKKLWAMNKIMGGEMGGDFTLLNHVHVLSEKRRIWNKFDYGFLLSYM